MRRYVSRHEDRVMYAMPGSARKPAVKKKKPYWPTWPLHFRPTTSVERTRQLIPIPDPNNLNITH